MRTKKSAKKLQMSLLAGTLAAAIALTGTFAWTSMRQRAKNVSLTGNNPGARLHDDFDGLNKDVYVENFTGEKDGMPVFVRVRLTEYMETGTYAGRYLDGKDDDDNPIDRGVTIFTPARDKTDAATDPADVNDVDTWPIHKPGTTVNTVADGAPDKEVHDYWAWDLGGSTIYMPTFNMNKDSESADINGTYEGTDGRFETPNDAYGDYHEYEDKETKTADAYYDLDDNIEDEYFTNDGTDPDKPKGGPNGDGGKLGENYEAIEETHTAKPTRDATVLTMDEWVKKGSPIGDYWVWDTDGWAYWAAPLMPQEATGTLLTRIRKVQDSAKCYYAINVEGQFATSEDVLNEEKGFNSTANGGITGEGTTLLEKIKSVIRGRDNNWYINEGSNVYRQIDPANGQTKALVCAGTDHIPGTSDDISGVIMTKDPLMIDSVNYGNVFLPADDGHPYYRGANMSEDGDKLLGTDDDTRIWHSGSDAFPGGDLTTEGANHVKVTTADGSETARVVAGGSIAFKAVVYKDAAGADTSVSQDVVWSITGNTSADTHIDDKGVLTVDGGQQTGANVITVTARAKADDRKLGSISVEVLDKNAVTVTVDAPAEVVKAGDTNGLTFTASTIKGLTPVTPSKTVWSIEPAVANAKIDAASGKLTLTDAVAGNTKITVKVTVTVDGTEHTATKTVTSVAANAPILTVSGKTSVEAGQSDVAYAVAFDPAGFSDKSVKWTAKNTAGADIAGVTIGESTGKLTIANNVKANTTIVVKATAQASQAQSAEGKLTVTVASPSSVTVTASADKVKKGESVTLSAVVNGSGSDYASQLMRWEIAGGHNDATTLTVDAANGSKATLAVAAGETAKTVTVRAVSLVDETVKGEKAITVGGGVDLGGATPENQKTVKIDDIDWYVLKIDTTNEKALILSKDILEKRAFNTTGGADYIHWWNSPLRTYLNEDWLNGKATLKEYAQSTTITVRTTNTGTATQNSTDKVFLLSEADVFGTEARGKISSPASNLYTTGSKLTIPNSNKATLNGSAAYWWLRSPSGGYDGSYQVVAHVYSDGTLGYDDPFSTRGVRPALWVKIDQ